MRESREGGRFAYAGIAGKHVSEESKGKKTLEKRLCYPQAQCCE